MSFPPRPPLGRGMQMPPMHMGMPGPMGVGVDPWGHALRMGVQVPPPPMPPPNMRGPPPFFPGGPSGGNIRDDAPVSRNFIQAKANLNFAPGDHPVPIQPTGPPITVFVGNITERWPDAMIRQLLATCGQIINWKRVQGASGKLQGFGFCEFNGPDAGLRAVRLLHTLEVADKKLVVKVDAKTSTVLDEFKAERKNRKDQNKGATAELTKLKTEADLDYMDLEMMETDERSRMRIDIIFREFKNDLEAYVPAGADTKDKDPTGKQAIQEKLHLLKLSSLEPPSSDADVTEDLAVEEGKREIITQEISKFRENMKQEQQREDERKKIGRERREREKEREESRQKRHDKDNGDEHSPKRRDRERDSSKSKGSISPTRRKRSRSSSRPKNESRRDRDRRGNSRNRDGERDRGVLRDRERDRDRDRDRLPRRRSRDREISESKPVDRDRSPHQSAVPHKPRYREREEEEEVTELKRIDRKARERETNYEERLRIWEHREAKKARDIKKDYEKQKKIEEEILREAKRMKQFFEDYDDEKHDSKYYKGKELQKRLADRATELESDNRDRQREREEMDEMKLRILTGSGTPNTATSSPATLFEKFKPENI